MNDLTIVMAYFNQPEIMLEHWDNLRAYEDEVAEHVRLVICDDGSQQHPLSFRRTSARSSRSCSSA
jgi:GT2 family glycosyltransferase